ERSMLRFFYWDRIGRGFLSGENEVTFVVHSPLHHLAFGKIQRQCQGRRKVDIKLSAILALDALNFGWVAHALVSSYMTRYRAITKERIELVTAKLERAQQDCAPTKNACRAGLACAPN